MKNQIKVVDVAGNAVSDLKLEPGWLVEKPHTQAVFDAVIAEGASQRQGTHSTLTKGEVSGGGRKPHKQKHTGRARQGSIRNPHYRHGGVVFGPKPNRNYALKVNRKVFALAFRSALSVRADNDSIIGLVDELKLENPSTKTIVNLLKALKLDDKKVLFVTAKKNANLQKSLANLAKVGFRVWGGVSPRDLLNYEYILVQPSVMEKWTGVY